MKKGIFYALIAGLLFGVSAPAAKVLLAQISPQLLAGLLYLGSGLGLLIVGFVRPRRGSASEGSLSVSNFPTLALAILFGGVAAPILLLIGLQRTLSSSASLLLNLEGVFTGLLAWMLFHENIGRRIAFGMLAITAGSVVLSWSGSFAASASGAIAIAAACFCWGMDNNLTQKISAADPRTVAMIKGMAAGSVNIILALLMGSPISFDRPLVSALTLGFMSYGLSLVFYILALRMLGTARTGNYFSVAPFFGAVIGVILLKEPLTAQLVVAGGLMAVGLWLHFSEHHEHIHTHEALFHEHAHVHDEHHQHPHAPGDPPGEPHSHPHRHDPLRHSHPHYPDIHHRHGH